MFPYYLRHKKPQTPAPRPPNRGGVGGFLLRVTGYVIIIVGVGATALMLGPGVPERFNPLAPLDPTAPAGPFTAFKLDRATATPEQCFATLAQIPDIRIVQMLDREVSDQCHIRGHTLVRGLWGADLAPVSTRCSIALRLYMWERHTVQPAAEAHLGVNVDQLEHFSSYSCRRIRTVRGDGPEMSSHATASAIDISGVVLTNGRRLTLASGWNAPNPGEQRFWRALRDGACDWFRGVLSPSYNQLHADHFHLEHGRVSVCR